MCLWQKDHWQHWRTALADSTDNTHRQGEAVTINRRHALDTDSKGDLREGWPLTQGEQHLNIKHRGK